ncbi:kelch-like protein 29 isoform X2 [Zootermopsis nevadensis]|nr:kelch-like protein 29 isoform X2 [Zootermopsis nevadensis]
MAVLLQSVNRKKVDILKSNDILSVLQASSMLQFESIQKICVEMIVHQWLTILTCLQTMVTAEELDLITLYHKAQALALWEFSHVRETDAFLELPVGYLQKYLGNDGLNTTEGEFEVFEAGLCWLQDKLEERKECVLRILDCIRFADIPLSDIKTMLLYPIISENTDYVQILQCIICIKEGKNPEEMFCIAESEAQTSRDSLDADGKILLDKEEDSMSKQKKAEQCKCSSKKPKVQLYDERVKVLNNCCFCRISVEEAITPVCDSELAVETSIAMDDIHDKDHVQFSTGTIAIARRLLSTPSRALPLFPCIVGHKRDRTGFRQRDSNDEIGCEKVTVDGKPYLIYFQEGTTQHLVPFLHLSKANEGPLEPTGYKVIFKGQDLYMIGGEYLLGYGNWNQSIWKYDLIREMWNFETSIATPRRHHSVCCLEDDIYIIGGFGRHRVIMDSVEKYNVGTKCWSRCASLPHNLYSAACCAYKGQIFVFGPQVYFYDPSSDKWFIMPEAALPPGIAFNCAMPHGEWIYLTGTYFRELVRFSPHFSVTDVDGRNSRFETLGYFCHNTSNTCLVHNVIYSFSTDEDGNMYVEAYSITEGMFSVLWNGHSNTEDSNGVSDFSPKHSIGCFPLIKY